MEALAVCAGRWGGQFEDMRNVKSKVGLLVVALLLAGTVGGCGTDSGARHESYMPARSEGPVLSESADGDVGGSEGAVTAAAAAVEAVAALHSIRETPAVPAPTAVLDLEVPDVVEAEPVVEAPVAPLVQVQEVGPVAAAPAVPAPLRVGLIGDSLIDQSYNEQYHAFAVRGMDVTVRARPGTPLSSPWMVDAAAAMAGSDALVVATATNDNVEAAGVVPHRNGIEAWKGYADRAVQAAGNPRCVVFVDMRENASPIYRTDMAGIFNAQQRAYATSRGWHVVAWSAVSAPHSQTDGWFVADELHFTGPGERAQAGADAYAATIAEAVANVCV